MADSVLRNILFVVKKWTLFWVQITLDQVSLLQVKVILTMMIASQAGSDYHSLGHSYTGY